MFLATSDDKTAAEFVVIPVLRHGVLHVVVLMCLQSLVFCMML